MTAVALPFNPRSSRSPTPIQVSPTMDNKSAHKLFCHLLQLNPGHPLTANSILRLPPHERNPDVIDQAARWCFSQVQSIPQPRDPITYNWMFQRIAAASMEMLNNAAQYRHQPLAAISPPLVPVPPVVPTVIPPLRDDLPVMIRTTVRRSRTGFKLDNIVGLISIVVMLGIAGLSIGWFVEHSRRGDPVGVRIAGLSIGGFVKQSTADLMKPGTAPRPRPAVVPPAKPPVVPLGKGGAAHPKPQPAPQQQVPPPVRLQNTAAAEEHITNAIKNARQGSFDEADRDAQKALRAAPGFQEAAAVRFLVAYQRQYSDLADEALDALNGNNVVFLGTKYGDVAFIERNGNSITFRVPGRNKAFTVKELNGTPGVRFGITKQFLDNAQNPANNLILGAWHFITQQTSDGLVDTDGSRRAARDCWQKAVLFGNPDIGEHATQMITLLDMK